MGMLRRTGGSSGWLETVGKTARKFAARGHTVQVDRGRGFGRIVEAIGDSIKTKHELDFIVDIAGFQLHQKSSNLVVFWLSTSALKLTKN